MVCLKRNGKLKLWVVWGVLIGVFLLRIMHLDLDLPGFGIALYQPIDEGIYSRMALNLYNHGNLFNSGSYVLATSPTFRTNLFGNIAQYVCMKVIGDNYYGFRLPYFLAALGMVIILLKTINTVLVENKVNDHIRIMALFGIMAYITIDFSFLMGSRVVENSILRALIVAIMFGGFLKYFQDEKKCYFIIGFCAVFSIFLVYFSNVFVLVPLAVLFFNQLARKQFQKAKKIFSYMFIGGISAFAYAEFYYICVWKEGALYNFFSSIFSFSGRIGGGSGGNIFKKCFTNMGWFWGANIFFFSFLLLFLTLIAFIFNTVYAIKKNDEKCLFVVSFIWGLLLQSIFTSDYIERKCLSIFPILIVNIVYFIIIWSREERLKEQYNRIFLVASYIISILLWVYALFLRQSKFYFKDYSEMDISFIIYTSLLQMIFVGIFIWVYIWKNEIVYFRRIAIGFTLLFYMLLNVYFAAKYVYCYNSYSEKQIMIDIGDLIGDGYVLGGYAHAYTLYNDIKPIVNYDEQINYMEEINCMLDYATWENMEYTIRIKMYNSDIRPLEIRHAFVRNMKIFGERRPIGLMSYKEDGEKYEEN
ncbi:MAG: hypothetical protein HFI03_00715 [Lachnospiraceae bacterium]|nr:hypothetical protein [Lachnospiraceae bacterium]